MFQIDQLNIKIPGISEAQASQIGYQIAEKVAIGLPIMTENRHIPELNIKMQGLNTTDTSQISDQIAQQIIKQISIATY